MFGLTAKTGTQRLNDADIKTVRKFDKRGQKLYSPEKRPRAPNKRAHFAIA